MVQHEKIYQFISRLFPRNLQERYRKLLIYADIKIRPDIYLGFWIFFGFLVSLAVAFFVSYVFDSQRLFFILFIGLFIAFQFFVYMLLNLMVDSKAHFVELILPDVLQLMASNLRAGMTIDRALLMAARPEFGSFQQEMVQVGKELATGRELDVALMSLTARIRSETLNKTLMLIISGLHSGGQIATLLEQTAKNLRNQQFLQEKIKSSVGTYVIFIVVAIGFGAPLLFGLSTVLVSVLTTMISKFDFSELSGSNLPVTFSAISISPSFIITFSMISLAASAFMGSLVVGLINKGKAREGLRYFLPILFLCYSIYFMIYAGVSRIFSALGLL